MAFNIDRDMPWVEAKLDLERATGAENASSQALKTELDYLASGPDHYGDQFITPFELFNRRRGDKVRSLTSRLVSSYMHNHIVRDDHVIFDETGSVIEKIIVYDNNDERFDLSDKNTKKSDQQDIILKEISVNGQTEYINITSDVRTTALEFLKRNYNLDKANLVEMNSHLIVCVYKLVLLERFGLSDTPRNAVQFNDLRKIIDSATVPKNRKKNGVNGNGYPKSKAKEIKLRNQSNYEIENKFISDFLSREITLNSQSNSPTSEEELFLIVIEVNHLIDMTDGEYGLDLFKELNEAQWKLILDNFEVSHSIYTTIANAIYTQSLTFYRSFYEEDTKLEQYIVNDFIRDESCHPSLRIIMASSVLLGLKSNLSDIDTHNLFEILNLMHDDNNGELYPFSSLVNITLNTLGELANERLSDRFVVDSSFEFCKRFDENFVTFSTGRDDREMILKNLDVMQAIDPHRAQRYFFNKLMQPLNPEFNPRIDKHLAHNAFYRNIGYSQSLAESSGMRKLAFDRKIDQDNNEWGRDLEKRIRDDEIFRLDVLKEAKSALSQTDQTTVEKIIQTYDPHTILRRNLAFIHVMRYYYVNSFSFDELSIESILSQSIDATYYEDKAHDFDDWLESVRTDSPNFFNLVKDQINDIPDREMKLPFEVFFMEANEVEIFQYYINPTEGPLALFNFVGKIRSWTSGYHGRLLVKMQAYMDQDTIRKDIEKNPQSYKRPEYYYDHYEHLISEERFYDEDNGIIRILKEAENNSHDTDLNLSEDEALMILKHFSETSFSAYIPQWLFFIIDHRFIDQDGNENLLIAQRAFEVLAQTKFPRHLMRNHFTSRGYLSENQSERDLILHSAAIKCLRKLPSKQALYIPFNNNNSLEIRNRVLFAGKRTKNILPERYEKLLTEFREFEAKPGHYFDYKKQAKTLLKTHRIDALKTIVDQALIKKNVTYPANAPLKPVFKGIVGNLVTNETFETAIRDIATNEQNNGGGVSSFFNFSKILINWAEKNHLNLNEVFGKAFDSYKPPEEIRLLQKEIKEIERQIRESENIIMQQKQLRTEAGSTLPLLAIEEETLHGKDSDIGLYELLERKTLERNRRIVALAENPSTFSDQAIMQIVTYTYNAVRQQFLMEVIISGGEVTAGLIEEYLENDLLPHKRNLLENSTQLTETERQKKLSQVNERIDFLMDTLAQMEGVEYFNDFNLWQSQGNRYRRYH